MGLGESSQHNELRARHENKDDTSAGIRYPRNAQDTTLFGVQVERRFRGQAQPPVNRSRFI